MIRDGIDCQRSRACPHAGWFPRSAMVHRAHAQHSVFEVLRSDSDKLWDPALKQIDVLLDEERLVYQIVDTLARRHPLSRRRGRLDTRRRSSFGCWFLSTSTSGASTNANARSGAGCSIGPSAESTANASEISRRRLSHFRPPSWFLRQGHPQSTGRRVVSCAVVALSRKHWGRRDAGGKSLTEAGTIRCAAA